MSEDAILAAIAALDHELDTSMSKLDTRIDEVKAGLERLQDALDALIAAASAHPSDRQP